MKKFFYIIALSLLAAGFISLAPKPVKIFIAGDSTAADKEQRAYPETGWGQVLPSYFTDEVIIENHARNGRSTRTFISEGRWDYLLSRAGKGDFVVIQFGHNDQSQNKPDRYTTPDEFKRNFERFVDDVRSRGATPILCTPVERRKFDSKGNFVDQHGNYPNLIRQVAKEKQACLIDMQHTSMDFLIGEGEEKSKQYFLHIGAGESEKYPDGKEDNTHFKPAGAMEMARLFVEGLRQLNIETLVGRLKPAADVSLKYTTQLDGLNKMQNSINHQLDEGKTK